MKQKSIFSISNAFIFVYLLAAFFYLYGIVQPELHYFAQQPPFQANKYFFSTYLSYPGGIINYVTLFITQFFSYNWLGSLIITLTLLLLLFLGYKIFGNFTKSRNAFFWMFLPVTILFSLFNNYFFPYTTALNILLVYTALFLSIPFLKASNPKWYFYYLMAPIIYYLAGGGSFIIYSLSYLIVLLYYSGFKKSILPVIVITLITTVLPSIAYKFIFNIPLSKAYLEYFPSDNLLLKKYDMNMFFYSFYYSVPALLLILSLLSRIQTKHKIAGTSHLQKKEKLKIAIHNSKIRWYKKFPLMWVMILITGITVLLIDANISKHKNNIVKADFYCSNENWDEVISTISSDKEYDIMFNYFYNRAIDNLDQYLDKYFDYPQLIGASGTFPDDLNYELLYIYYSDYYFDLGYISEAQQWSFKALSGFPFCPRILKRLVITNLILGNYNIAGKFLNILDDNLLSKNFVEQYTPFVKDTSLVLADKLIMTKRSFMPVNLITPSEITERFKDLIDKNKQNKHAYEHMQMNSLLNHQLGTFYHYLPQASNYYNVLPRVFEEALLIMRTKKAEDNNDYQISQTTLKSFLGFSDIYGKFGNNKERAKSMLGAYKNTLFYYTMFDSPKITKKTLLKVSGNEYNL